MQYIAAFTLVLLFSGGVSAASKCKMSDKLDELIEIKKQIYDIDTLPVEKVEKHRKKIRNVLAAITPEASKATLWEKTTELMAQWGFNKKRLRRIRIQKELERRKKRAAAAETPPAPPTKIAIDSGVSPARRTFLEKRAKDLESLASAKSFFSKTRPAINLYGPSIKFNLSKQAIETAFNHGGNDLKKLYNIVHSPRVVKALAGDPGLKPLKGIPPLWEIKLRDSGFRVFGCRKAGFIKFVHAELNHLKRDEQYTNLRNRLCGRPKP